MAEKIVYLVTSGVHSDMTPEAVLSDAVDAHRLKAMVEDGEVWAFPVLDYVPTKVTEHSVKLVRSRYGMWELDETSSYPVWDFQVATLAPRVTFMFGIGHIFVHHRDAIIAREHAAEILKELNPSDGS